MERPDLDTISPPAPLMPTVSEPQLPRQDRRSWYPERLAADIDAFDENHLIRGYD